MNWLNNPWIVGIGGGILSGLFVTVISRTILSRRDRREYAQKLRSANQEIIYALRQGISEEHLPDGRVVESFVNATARKYAVDKGDLLNLTQICEELVKEIMDSSFISATTKQEYCKKLDPLASVDVKEESLDRSENRAKFQSADLAEYRSRMVSMTSAMVGTITAMTTMGYMISSGFDDESNESLVALMFPAVGALLVTTMFVTLAVLRERLSTKGNNKTKENRGEGSSID